MIKKNKDELNEMEYLVTQENGTEPPFQNEYWNHFDKGIYVDKLSGKPLFTSEEKFESNCGWPSFSKALNDDEIIEYYVSCDKLEVVDIPVGYTHNIENLGDTDMVTIMWVNEMFDPNQPDTYFLEV